MNVIVAGAVDVSLAAKLDAAAKQKGTTRSAIVACAIEHFLTEHPDAAITTKRGGNQSDRDGKDAAAREIIRANAGTIREIQAALAAAGIRRSHGWISNTRSDIKCKPSVR